MTVTSRSNHDHRRHVSAIAQLLIPDPFTAKWLAEEASGVTSDATIAPVSEEPTAATTDSCRRTMKVSTLLAARRLIRNLSARCPEQEAREAGGQQEPTGGFGSWLEHADSV